VLKPNVNIIVGQSRLSDLDEEAADMNWLKRIVSRAEPEPSTEDLMTIQFSKAELDALMDTIGQYSQMLPERHPKTRTLRAGLDHLSIVLTERTTGGGGLSQSEVSDSDIWLVAAPMSDWTAMAHMVSLSGQIESALEQAHTQRNPAPMELWTAGKKILVTIPPSAREDISKWLDDVIMSMANQS
jgi:hypothetical protein